VKFALMQSASVRACTRRSSAQTEIAFSFASAARQGCRGIFRVKPNPAAIRTRPATIAAPELPPVKGSGWSLLAATVVDGFPSVATVPEIVVDVASGSVVVVVGAAIVTLEIVVDVSAVVVVTATLDVVVVDPPVVGGGVDGGVDVVDVPTTTVDVVTADEDVVFGTVEVVVDGLAVLHPLSNTAIPTAVQFLPAYFSPGPKSNGGMMSPHFVCFGIAG
jgi:hypothetical protein